MEVVVGLDNGQSTSKGSYLTNPPHVGGGIRSSWLFIVMNEVIIVVINYGPLLFG